MVRLNNIPFLGSGIGFRRQISKQILNNAKNIDFLEVITEHYIDVPLAKIEELRDISKRFIIIPHGIDLSIGTDMPLDREYLDKVLGVLQLVNPPYYSDHFCFTKVPGLNIGHLTPLWFTKRTVEVVVKKIKKLQKILKIPIVLENITYVIDIPNADMSQEEFINRIVDKTNCGLLLDVTNVYTNSINHRFDPKKFIDRLPLENVVQLHLAGGYWDNGILIDSHSEPVVEEVWMLVEYICKKVLVKATLLEHDSNFKSFDTLLNQLGRAREILKKVD